MSFPRYTKYKPSGVEWLGEVPEHWKLRRLKFLCDIQTGDKDTVDAVEDGLYPFFVRSQTVERINSVTFDCEAVLTAGDGVGVGKVFHYHNGPFDFHQRVYMLNKFRDVTGTFLFHFLKENFYKVALEGGAKSTVDSLRRPLFMNFMVSVPPDNEQRSIVEIVERESSKIDGLVGEQRRLIELLKEKRQAVISHAVTKGLNPHAPLKPSGIEWLGDVPEHWEVGRVKNYFRTCSGGTPNTSQQELYYADEEDGIPWVRTTDLQNDVLRNVEVFITEQALKDTACSVLPPGTVMVAMYGGDGTVGKNGLLAISAAINQAVCGLLPSTTHSSEYAFRFMQFYRPHWMIGAESSRKDPNISQERVRNAPLPKPPRDEQEAIVKFLDTLLGEFDALTAEAERGIELLQERRTALISAAVTGKIDVRGLVEMEAA